MSTIDASYASTRDLNIFSNIFVPTYVYDNNRGFIPQLNTYLQGDVNIGDISTNYTLKLNGQPITPGGGGGGTTLSSGQYFGDYLRWNPGTSSWAVGSLNVTIGKDAGAVNQGSNGVAIGTGAGNISQGANSIAIGVSAGYDSQSANSIILNATGGDFANTAYRTTSGFYVAPIRLDPTLSSLYYNSSSKEITYGNAPSPGTTLSSGTYFGDYLRWNPSSSSWAVGSEKVTIGANAGNIGQGANAIAIGVSAGYDTQLQSAVAIGYSAGKLNQSEQAVAIGDDAGTTNQARRAVAIGHASGSDNQKEESVAIGPYAGQTRQRKWAVAVGIRAGNISQGEYSVAIGPYAGVTNQASGSIILNASEWALNSTTEGFFVNPVRLAPTLSTLYYDPDKKEITYGNAPGGGGANVPTGTVYGNYLYWDGGQYALGSSNITLGSNAGRSNQQPGAVAIGYKAGFSGQQTNSLAIGPSAGAFNQGLNGSTLGFSIAIGERAGENNQYAIGIAIGTGAGNVSQGEASVAIGGNAARYSQRTKSIAIGSNAGYQDQSSYSVAIGFFAGSNYQKDSAIAIGNNAGADYQSQYAIAIGLTAGTISQGASSIAIGYDAGRSNQLTGGIAIGSGAGNASQGLFSVAVGYVAGNRLLGSNSIAIGRNAAYASSGINSIAIGAYVDGAGAAGLTQNQANNCIAIGRLAGYTNQSNSAIAIGQGAGFSNQGVGSIAIGAYAGLSNQASGSVVIYGNSTENTLDNLSAGTNNYKNTQGLFVAPIRGVTATTDLSYLAYNPTTKEIVYTPIPVVKYASGSIYWVGPTSGGSFSSNYLFNCTISAAGSVFSAAQIVFNTALSDREYTVCVTGNAGATRYFRVDYVNKLTTGFVIAHFNVDIITGQTGVNVDCDFVVMR